MYFANMYCYGHDNDIVGITGIRGCIGVIFVAQDAMFAIHIPDGPPVQNMKAGKDFASFVKSQGGMGGGNRRHLFVLANGINRNSDSANSTAAETEALAIKKALGSPPTTLYRLMKHLGTDSGGYQADAAAIMLERVGASPSNAAGCALWYKKNNDVTWIIGGKSETGQYKYDSRYLGNKVPGDLESHWWRMNEITCKATSI